MKHPSYLNRTRNNQIDKHRTYFNFQSLVDITMSIDITETEADSMVHILI